MEIDSNLRSKVLYKATTDFPDSTDDYPFPTPLRGGAPGKGGGVIANIRKI